MYSTGNYTQHPLINQNGKEYKKRIYMYIYIKKEKYVLSHLNRKHPSNERI